MGIKDFLEEAAGAVAAEQGLKAVDPNADFLEKAAAAAAGFEGVNLVQQHFEAEHAAAQQQQDQAPAQDYEPSDDPSNQNA